jgi:alpha-galactosidase
MTSLHLNLDSFAQTCDSQTVNASRVTIHLPRLPRRFYRHGWQSWSLAAWTDLTPLPMQKPEILLPLQVDPKYVYDTNPNGSWLGAVEFEDGSVLLLGAVRIDAHVRLNGDRFEGWYEADTGDWFIGFGESDVVFSNYAKQLREKFGTSKKKSAPRVWCSWYSLGTAINEPRLARAFDELNDLPFDVLQIDDGWQDAIGDWTANAKFPMGMATLAEKIKSTGRKAGLWLAPLIAVKSSRLFREHAAWFVRDEHGRHISAGFNWGEQLYALDTTHPAVLGWLAALVRQVRAWGYDYLKLDFLYAGALPGKRHVDKPREAAYRNGLRVMRQAMGEDAFFLACGTAIIPSLGLCDAIRIGPDVSGKWESYRDAVLLQNPTTPGTKNAIRTTLNRLWLSPLVHIDPDVAYFNSKNNSLTPEQKGLLQDLALICNYKAASDLLGWLSADEKKALRNFLEVNPAITQSGGYTFQIDGRAVDFSPAMSLLNPAAGWDAIARVFIS